MSQDNQLQAFEIECIESFEMRTLYRVKALNRAHAIRAIEAGLVAYDRADPLEDSDEFMGVIRAELLPIIPEGVEVAPLRTCAREEITPADEADVEHLFI